MSRVIRSRSGPIKVAIADDKSLIFSDDYREGWIKGFKSTGVEVKTFDISILRRITNSARSIYRSTVVPGTAKQIARDIVRWGADFVWCHHGRAASNGDFLSVLHKAGIATAVYLCDEPYESGETGKYSPKFRYVFSMDPCTVEPHRLSRPKRDPFVFYLPPAADTHRFTYRPYLTRDGKLLRKTPAFFLGNGSLAPRPSWLNPVLKLVPGADIRFMNTSHIKKGDKRWVSMSQHPALYSDCVVGLNVHRDPRMGADHFKRRVVGRSRHDPVPAGMPLDTTPPRGKGGTGFWNDANLPAAHVNPRFFEMAACGTLVVNDDHRSELKRMFPMAPRAESPEHFLELVRYYIDHPSEAEQIGRACYELISRRHSYHHRASEVLIRAGFKESLPEEQLSCLGPPKDWLTPQDCGPHGISSSWDPTGPSERWSPRFGMSWIRTFGSKSAPDSLDAPTPL